MITQGPFTLTVSTTLPLDDPGANSNNPATAVQLQNASPFIIEVNVGGDLFTIQSFTAQTIPTAGGGQSMSVLPIQSGASGRTMAPNSLTVVWLLAGESSPMVDGPLTAAAIFSSLAAGGLTGASGGIEMAEIAVAAGATVDFSLSGIFSVWNIGWEFDATLPTAGQITIGFPGPSFVGGKDSITVQEGASNRLAGLVFGANPLQPFVTNNMDQAVKVFLIYSPS